MKIKKIFSLVLMLVMIFSFGTVMASAKYDYSYFISDVEYVDDYTIEATIVFTGQYGSTVDVETLCYLAVYDDVEEVMLNVSAEGYDYYKPFASAQRFEVKQRVEIPDLNRLRYRVAAILVTTNDAVTPSGFADNYSNTAIMKRSDFFIKDRAHITAKIDNFDLDRAVNMVNLRDVNIVNQDELREFHYFLYADDFEYGIEIGDVDLHGLAGYTLDMYVDVSDESNMKLLSAEISDKNKILEINPLLFKGIDSRGRINYYKTFESDTVTIKDKVAMVSEDIDVDVYVNEIGEWGFNLDLDSSDVDFYEGDSFLKFVDTDGDGYYDTLHIDRYYSFEVGEVSEENYKITPKRAFTVYNSPNAEAIVLNPENEYISWSLKDETGKKITLSDINKGDIITYAESYDGDYTYYDITVLKNSVVSGKISSIELKKSKIDGADLIYYKIGDNSYMLNLQDDSSNPAFEPGYIGDFKLTKDNKIVSAEIKNIYCPAVAVAVSKDASAFEDKGIIRLIKPDGTVADIEFADSYILDSEFERYGVDVITELADISGNLILYSCNSRGKITDILTDNIAFTGVGYKLKSETGVCNKEAGTLGSVKLTNASSIIALENGGSTSNKNSYSLISKNNLVDEGTYEYMAIVDENNAAVIVLIKDFAQTEN